MKSNRIFQRLSAIRCALYNAVLLATFLVPATGCGKPAPPPPGAEDDVSTPVIESDTDHALPQEGEATPNSSTQENPPADDSGAK